MSRGQRLAANKEREQAEARVFMRSAPGPAPQRNTRSAAAAQGKSQPKARQPPALPTAPPPPSSTGATGNPEQENTSAHAHAVPTDILDAMQAATKRMEMQADRANASSPATSASDSLSNISSIALTTLHEANMKAEKDKRELEKSLLISQHEAMLKQHEAMLAEKESVAATHLKMIEDLQARLDQCVKEVTAQTANAKRFESMYELQKNDHARMFEAMLAKMQVCAVTLASAHHTAPLPLLLTVLHAWCTLASAHHTAPLHQLTTLFCMHGAMVAQPLIHTCLCSSSHPHVLVQRD